MFDTFQSLFLVKSHLNYGYIHITHAVDTVNQVPISVRSGSGISDTRSGDPAPRSDSRVNWSGIRPAAYAIPDSKAHGAIMGPTWVLSTPDGPHVGPMNLAIGDVNGCVENYPDRTLIVPAACSMNVALILRTAIFALLVIPLSL